MSKISPLAVVENGAKLADDVEVGPFSYIGPEVEVGAGTVISCNVTLVGKTTIGRQNRVHPMSVIGLGEDGSDDGRCILGDANVIREHVTIHTRSGDETLIGTDNLIMVDSIVGGGVRIGDHGIFANCTHINSGAIIEDYVRTSSFVVVETGATVGAYTMLVGYTGVTGVAPPFAMVQGFPMRVRGVNTENLKRCGFSADDIHAIKDAFRELFTSSAVNTDVLAELLKSTNPHLRQLAQAAQAGLDREQN